MARMMPSGGPNITASPKAEPDVYWRLSKLSDDFVVIHSLPWLCAAVKTLHPSYAQTGELDFVVLHPKLGILAIEVKGGKFKYDQNRYVFTRTNQVFDPVGQLRRGTFALNAWLKNAGIYTPIGYAFISPDVSTKNSSQSLAFQDPTLKMDVTIDYNDLPNLDKRIVEIMEYWVNTLKVQPVNQEQIDKIVDLICPSIEYGVGWDARIDFDNKTWLILDPQQKRVFERVSTYDRTRVYGGPGTGKTVLACSLARKLNDENKKVLFIVFNRRLEQKIKKELDDVSGVTVKRFYALCGEAATRLNIQFKDEENWYAEAVNHLSLAFQKKLLPNYDVLIIDEGQVFHSDWYLILKSWIPKIHVFCDETQAFSFEEKLSNSEIGELIQEEQSFLLTVNMRSPKPVFDRIEASIPTSYQQYSPRQLEHDTLEEKVTSDSENDLISILESLRFQKISRDSIAVITTSREIKSMKEKGVFDKISLLADLDTSEKVRGLEFPIVIAYDLDIWDTSLAVNAYARATTRVIAIYNQRVLSGANQEKDLFAEQLRKNPMVSDVLKAPWGFLIKNMNWDLVPIFDSPTIYWHQNFKAWLIKVSRHMTIQEELWGAHLLLTSEYPVILVRADNEFLSVSRIDLPSKSLSDSVKVDYLKLASVCNKCGEYCFRDLDGNVLCCHCSYKTLTSIPNAERKLFNSEFLSVPLLSLQKYEQLKEQDAKLINDHVKWYFGGDKKIGYQSLLIYIGVEISNMPSGLEISNKDLIDKFMSVFGESKHLEFSQVLPTCTNYWIGKGWLEKVDKGVYRRTDKSPVRELVSGSSSEELAE